MCVVTISEVVEAITLLRTKLCLGTLKLAITMLQDEVTEQELLFPTIKD